MYHVLKWKTGCIIPAGFLTARDKKLNWQRTSKGIHPGSYFMAGSLRCLSIWGGQLTNMRGRVIVGAKHQQRI